MEAVTSTSCSAATAGPFEDPDVGTDLSGFDGCAGTRGTETDDYDIRFFVPGRNVALPAQGVFVARVHHGWLET